MTEVEMKARVEDPEEIERAVASLAKYGGNYLKEDRYYCHGESVRPVSKQAEDFPEGTQKLPSEQSRFRLRLQESGATVTYKRKRLEGNHEVNEEHEFGVSDPEAFDAFARGIGYRVCARKRKSGREYRMEDGTGIEIAEVAGLGWYVEIEVLVEDGGPEEVTAAKERVAELFRQLGIGQERFEPRYYIDMLAEAGKDSSHGNT